jgi:hypothetical protein
MVVEEGHPGLVVASGSGAILAIGGIRHCTPEFGRESHGSRQEKPSEQG